MYETKIQQFKKGITMGFFGKILNKLGIKKDKAEATSAAMGKPAAKPAASVKSAMGSKPAASMPKRSEPIHHPSSTSKPATPATPAAAPMEMVDVVSKLETMAKGTKFNWKESIVDLLKVLDLDSSLEARKELATELGASADVMADNVKMNVWLHKAVLTEIAKNGGNIPKELLD